MYQDVAASNHRCDALARQSTRKSPLLVALFLAFGLLLLGTSAVLAEGNPQDRAEQAARTLLGRVRGQLAGGTVGRPVLVRSLDDLSPSYYVVPVNKHGKIVGLVGVSSDGGSWQWYTEGYDKGSFPPVSAAEARGQLSSRGDTGETVIVAAPDRKLYWAAVGGNDTLVSVDSASDVSSNRRAKADGRQGDILPGSSAGSEGSDSSKTSSGETSTLRSFASALPVSKNLSVPHYYQVNSYFCGPGSMQMIFDYYNPPIQSQQDIANVMSAKDWGAWKGAYADDLLRTGRFSSLSRAVLDSSLVGFRERSLGYGAIANFWSEGGSQDPDYATRYTDLKTLVNSGFPLMLLTYYDGNHTIGHFRVLKGYDDATGEFIVHDPWYSAPYYGPDVHFKQEYLVDNLWTRYSRWAVLFAPWSVSVDAPATVSAGTPFTVSATVRYRAPHPFEGRAPVTESQATLQAPSGFTVSTPTQSLSAITSSGQYQSVSWTVTPPASYAGGATFRVTGKGKYTASSTSYSTYTDWAGGEASRTVQVDSVPPSSVSVTPSSVTSLPEEFRNLTSVYSDASGADDIRSVMLLVNSMVAGEKALYASYSSATNNLYLRSADNTTWLGPVQPGAPTVLDNGYARLDAARTTVGRSGTQLKMSWAVSLRAPMSGSVKSVYLQAEDYFGNLSTWKQLGTWLVNRPAVAGNVTEVGAVVPPGKTVAVNAAYSDPDGYGNIQSVQLLINKTLGGTGSVWVRYDRPDNKLYLRSGDNTKWLGPIVPGSSSSLDNGRAVLVGANTRVSATGTTLKVSWGLKFNAAFSGERYNLYSVAVDRFGSLTELPWLKKGTYGVSAAPSAEALSPYSSVSRPDTNITVTSTLADPDGATDIATARLLVSTSLSQVKAVSLKYVASTNRLYLLDDAGTTWRGGLAPGATATVSNTYGTLRAATTTVSRSGTKLTIKWSLSFRTPYSGRRYNVYSLADDSLGVSSGYKLIGNWTVNRQPVAVSLSPKSSYSAVGGYVLFTSTYADPDGASNLTQAHYMVTDGSSASKAMAVRYDAVTNKLWMRKADLSGWVGGVAPGTATRFGNGYATLDAGKSSVARDGTKLILRWSISFSSGMKGRSLKQYLWATDKVGRHSARLNAGSWSVR